MNNRNFFVFGVMKCLPIVMQKTIYNYGQYNLIQKDSQVQSMTSLYTAKFTSKRFLRRFDVLRNLPDITQINDKGNNFIMMVNSATHEPCLLQTPEYLPSAEVDNIEYEKKHSNRFVYNGRKIKMSTPRQIIHYHANMASLIQLGNWFDYMRENSMEKESPLASRMRPVTLDEVVGQKHIIGKDKLLYRAIKADKLGSVIFYGPPGTGKTTLAKVIANTTSARFEQINATVAGKKDMEEIVKNAKDCIGMYGQKTILFVDEIHRFNKSQQDYLLPFVEDGTVTLIGATTENPYFEVNNALLSRSRIFELKPLEKQDIKELVFRAVYDEKKGMGAYGADITDEAAEFQGGVGTAGSANIGKRYAMFEAIHGSAPRMVKEGRDIYADPCSVIRTSAMLLAHIGYQEQADKLYKALDICTITEKKLVMTGRDTGATGAEFADYIMETIEKM